MHKYTFFSGKGGVGKTTLAAATAVRTAQAGKRTLIVSTDPASNLADVFERPIGPRITEIAQNLFALEIDPDTATKEYGERALAPLRAVLPPDAMKVLEEQFRSACTVEIASFDRFTDFLEDTEFDHVVFDTAPTGHTLRLLELPYDYARQVEMMVAVRKDDAGATGAKGKLDALVRRLKDPRATTFLLVIYPEYTPIFEAKRAAEDLKESGIEVQGVIANFLLEEDDCSSPFSQSRYSMQQHYLKVAEETFRLPIFKVPMLPSEPAGRDALDRVGRELLGMENIALAVPETAAGIGG